MDSAPPFTEAQVQAILDAMRGGATVTVGGSRCHTSFGCRDGSFVEEDFDEGTIFERPSSERAQREAIAQHPSDFRPLLQAKPLRALRAAFEAKDWPATLEALEEARQVLDPMQHLRVFAIALKSPAWPSEEDLVLVRQVLAGGTAWHAFLDVAGWQLTPARGRQGVDFVDRLLALVQEPRGYESRASFRVLAGDKAGAIEDLRLAINLAPSDAWWRAYVESRLKKLEAEIQA